MLRGDDPTSVPNLADEGPGADLAGAGRRPGRLVVRSLGLVALLGSAVLQIAALFPKEASFYPALSSSGSTISQQIVLAVGFAAAAVLLAVPGRRPAVAAGALAVGATLAGAGLVISDLGQILPTSSAAAGLVLLVAAWAVGALGAVLAVIAQPLGRPARPDPAGRRAPLVVLTAVAAVVLGVALLPAWDSYHLTSSVTGNAVSETMGDAFASSTPGWATFGDVVFALALAVVPILAVLWRPARVGVFLTGGVLVVVVGQLVSGLFGNYETTPALFGLTAAQARSEGIVIHSSLTAWYDVEVIAVVALLVLLVARWWTPAGGSLLDTYPSAGGPTGSAPPGPAAGWPAPPAWPGVPPGSTARPDTARPPAPWAPAGPAPWAPPPWPAPGGAGPVGTAPWGTTQRPPGAPPVDPGPAPETHRAPGP